MNFQIVLTNFIFLTALASKSIASPLSAPNAQAKSESRSGAQQTVVKQITLFNSGNLQQAAQTGYEVLRNDPGNSLARYYYAQTLYKLNRNADAKSQFAECYKTSNDLKMKANCYDALKTLAALPTGSVSPLSSSSSSSAANSTAANSTSPNSSSPTPVEHISRTPENGLGASQSSGNGSSSSSSKPEVPTGDPALISRKLQIMTEGSANIEHRRRQMLIDVDKAKERAAEHMNGIEQVYQRPIMVDYRIIRWEQYENPEYSRELERSQRELKVKTEDLNADFNRREAEILADCKARAAVYDQVSSGLKSQQKIGTSQIQLTPQHSNSFVRHYVNYDGSDPVSLKARQGELSNTKPETGTKSGATASGATAKAAIGTKAATRISKP